jgi:hypothetical protein
MYRPMLTSDTPRCQPDAWQDLLEMRVLRIRTGIGQILRTRAARLDMLYCTIRWSP